MRLKCPPPFFDPKCWWTKTTSVCVLVRKEDTKCCESYKQVRPYLIKSGRLTGRFLTAAHETKSDFLGGLHETGSDFSSEDSKTAHEIESDFPERPHEMKLGFLEMAHEIKSDSDRTAGMAAALPEWAAEFFLEDLRQTAGAGREGGLNKHQDGFTLAQQRCGV